MMIRVLKNFSGGGATLPDFLHVGVRDVWPNAQHELRLGDNLLRCFQNCCFSPYIGDEFSPIASITIEAHLDNQGHVSRSVQTAKIFLFGRERRKDRQ